jgi:ribosomal protein L11 methyltransferase
LIRLALRVRRDAAEVVLAELLELAPGGVEESEDGEIVEYAIYGAPGELPDLPALRAVSGGAFIEVTTTEVADDWADRWRSFHRPIDVGPLHVRPPWEPSPPEDRLDVVIDPGQAFGTGAHHTTRLCLELLTGIEPGGPLVDLGCGSGVLAVAAATLGWEPVAGVDHDPLSVAATLANAGANGVDVTATRFDLLRDGPVPSAPTVVANILRPILLAVARAGFAGEPPRSLILSGLLIEEADEVAAAYEPHGLTERDRRTGGEWVALLLAG